MKRNEILNAISMFARSQGFYCRLLQRVREDESILEYLEEQNFGDVLDMIIFLES